MVVAGTVGVGVGWVPRVLAVGAAAVRTFSLPSSSVRFCGRCCAAARGRGAPRDGMMRCDDTVRARLRWGCDGWV